MMDVAQIHELGGPVHIATAWFLNAAINLQHVRVLDWPCDADAIPAIPGERFRCRAGGNHHEVLVERDGLVATVEGGGGSASVRVAATGPHTVDSFVVEIRDLLPPTIADPEKPTVPITFWSYHPQGARSRHRRISVPTWGETFSNYSEATFNALLPVIDHFTPGAAGQLLLWHGPPGTGKTFALRSLAWEWRGWCDLHYVTDPEVLFGDYASYLLDVLLDDEGGQPVADGAVAEADVDQRSAAGRWRLLVLEDTGEMMSADARERAGQGLGRLLNVVDGMIGQGLRVLVLVTTNERITKLHPAVSRAGRCAAKVLFTSLPIREAREWLENNAPDVDHPSEWETDPPAAVTIADLFALRAGSPTDASEPVVGFA